VISHFLLRHSGWALLVATAGVAACSNTPNPPPDTFVNAAIGGGTMCSTFPSLKTSLQIGTAISGHPNTVQDGGSDRNANVNVSCTVHPQGSGFDIELTAIENGPQGGSLTISSPQGQGIVTTMTSSGISASFVSQGGVYREQAGTSDTTGCTITYLYDSGGSVGGVAGDEKVPTDPPIAAGRIWGHIKCPKAEYQSQPGVFCDAEADFTFEQCNQ
jgi:hypothetical protein